KEEKKQKKFMDLSEACEFLKLKPATLYSYNVKRVIPFYRLRGRKIYYRIEDLENFILNEQNLVKSNDQIEAEAIENLLKEKI
ncbi:MAG TPA: helix-turn-helix domain-containing protein, partial [Candidatus Cloacimonadota bacterium]|nr:helix-turn-helix domain-containing protein [Candidatus Cloacimonadota bacterium]